jgi:CBS domain-containing protein
MKIAEIMSRPIITLRLDTRIEEAARLLVELGISTLPVVDGAGALAGYVSESATRAPTVSGAPKTVADVMTKDPQTIGADSEVSKAARIMLESGIERLPVVRGRRVVGIVSRGDLVKVMARDVPVAFSASRSAV